METIGDVGAGHTLGRYELLIPIASGGMASVWAARMKGTRGFSKIVAVKLMLAEHIDDLNFEKMFLDEAEIASQIKHPNVVEIIDLGEQDGVLYQVMEWIDGEPLNQVIRALKTRKESMPMRLAVRIGAQACAGLHAAHDLVDADGNPVNIVHRDVSPQNLLVTYDGSVRVVDFGVAKAATNTHQTTVGQMKGKAPYMAPEQALGERVDRRTDVFALGIVMYQLTTGKHPFRAENDLATLKRIVDRTPVAPPSTVVPEFPQSVEAVILRALAKKRDERFESMAAMMRALEAALPPDDRASSEDVALFVKRILGERGDKRRAAIREALRLADERTSGKRGGGIPDLSREGVGRAGREEPASSPSHSTPSATSTPTSPSSASGASSPSSVSGADDLEQYVAQPERANRSVVGALVIAVVIAATAVALYLWEASGREAPPVPPAPTSP